MEPSMLASLETDELREVCKRLVRSQEGLELALNDVKEERKELEDEKAYLNSTIELTMQELQKLNIGAASIPEPKLEEGPVQFLGRFWEKVKPRDTAYRLNEHVGEIEKPAYCPDGNLHIGGQVAQQSQELRRQLADRFSDEELRRQLSERFSMFKGAVTQATGGSANRGAEQRTDPTQRAGASMKQLFGYLANPGGMPDVGPDSTGPGDEDKPPAASATPADAKPHDDTTGVAESVASTGTHSAASSKSTSRESPGASQVANEDVVEETLAPEKPSDAVSADCSGTAEPPKTQTVVPETVVAKESSSLLISVEITLGDGTVAPCKVYASDRCKEVAQNFVEENSLKAPFEAPLRAYLTEVEANAVTFPVQLQADIMEIRNKYSKK